MTNLDDEREAQKWEDYLSYPRTLRLIGRRPHLSRRRHHSRPTHMERLTHGGTKPTEQERVMRQVSTIDDLVMLESGTVLRGPDWHAEVYVKFSDVEFYAPGSETPYRASEVQTRGPYTVLWPLTDQPNGGTT